MEISFDSVRESQHLIKRLLRNIEEATEKMNQGFQETMVRHEQEFMKCYKLKIYQLVKLFEQLKATIQDKFINNTLALQLQTVLKERDYFKYECLKLNSQLASLLDDHKNLTAQANNSSQQITIYKHLLESEKLKTNQIQGNVERLKKSLADIAIKTVPQLRNNHQIRQLETNQDLIKMKKQIREKNEVIRALRQRVQDLQRSVTAQHQTKVEKKQLYELFKVCVQGWKRQQKVKKKDSSNISLEQLSPLSKKQLLRILFSHNEFLYFLERLLFDQGFKVIFQTVQENYAEKNRIKLFQFMSKKRLFTSPRGCRL